MLKLICGAPGSGKTAAVIAKTEACLKKSAPGEAKRIYIIYPEQETVSAESRILGSLPNYAPLTVEIDNFSRLADAVFRSLGGVCRTRAGRNQKKLAMWRALGELPEMGGRTPDRVDEALGTVSEFSAAGATPEKLAAAAKKLSGDLHLSGMLRDYSLIYAVYSGFLSEAGSDSAQDAERLCALLSANSFFSGSDVYIDGFTSFTGIEYKIIGHLLDQADDVIVTLGGNPEQNGIWLAEIRDTAARLCAMAEQRGIITGIELIGDDSKRAAGEAQRVLCRDMWRSGALPYTKDPGDDVRLVCCRTPIAEAEFVASDIARRVRTEAARYGDFAVVVRSFDAWRGIPEAVFSEHGIPAFFSRGAALCDHPAVRMLLRAVSAAAAFRREDVADLLKTGYTGLAADDCDLFIKYSRTWRLNRADFLSDADWDMNPDGFVSGKGDSFTEEILARVNAVRTEIRRTLLPLCEALSRPRLTMKDACTAVYRYLTAVQLRDRLTREAEQAMLAGNSRAAQDAAGVWNSIIETLDTAACAGEDTLTPDELCDLLRTLFDGVDISAIPSSADSVTVGSADMLRAGSIRRVYILGLCDGEFPSPIRRDGFFSEREEKLLRDAGIPLLHDTGILSSQEFYYFRRAAALSSNGVTALYHTSDLRCGVARPSSAVTRMLLLFPALRTEYYNPADAAASVWDARSAQLCMMSVKQSDSKLPLLLALSQCGGLPVIGRYTRDAALSPDSLSELFSDSLLYLSQSRLDTFAACRFKYLCKYILRLKPDGEAKFSYSEAGSFMHSLLEHLVPEMAKRELSAAEISGRIDALSRTYIDAVCPARSRGDARLSATLDRVSRAAYPVAQRLAEDLAVSGFTPFGTEIRIDANTPGCPEPVSIALENGKTTLRLSGVIDRADAFCAPDGTYVRVIDYKTGNKVFSLNDVDKGRNLQLLIYLYTLCASRDTELMRRAGAGAATKPLKPAGMLYCIAKPPEKTVPAPLDEESYRAEQRNAVMMQGILLDNPELFPDSTGTDKMLRLTENELENLRSRLYEKIRSIAGELVRGDVRTCSESGAPQDCDFCDYGAVCRQADIAEQNGEDE